MAITRRRRAPGGSDLCYLATAALAAGFVLAACATSAAAAPASLQAWVPPPRWGGNNNTLAFSAKVNMTDVADAPTHPNWQFLYHYDWTYKVSRYEHGAGQDDEVCAGSGPVGSPCTVLNALDGVLYIMFPEEPAPNNCCQCRASWAPFTIRSDWLQDGGTSYVGRAPCPGNTAAGMCDSWLKKGTSENYYYATADSDQTPVRYHELKHGDLKQWQFVAYLPQTPPQSLFEPPANCPNRCSSRACTM